MVIDYSVAFLDYFVYLDQPLSCYLAVPRLQRVTLVVEATLRIFVFGEFDLKFFRLRLDHNFEIIAYFWS